MDADRLLGWTRIGQIVALLVLATGLSAGLAPVAWIGTALLLVSLAGTTAAKLRDFGRLSVTPRERTVLTGTWGLLMLSLAGVVVVLVERQLSGTARGLLLPFLLTTVALLVGYRLAVRRYFPDDAGGGGEDRDDGA